MPTAKFFLLNANAIKILSKLGRMMGYFSKTKLAIGNIFNKMFYWAQIGAFFSPYFGSKKSVTLFSKSAPRFFLIFAN